MKEEQIRVRREQAEQEIKDLQARGVKLGEVDLDDVDSNKIRQIRLSQLEKEKNDLSNHLKITGKRIDHLERAFRKEEINILPRDYEAQREKDYRAWEKLKEITLTESRRKHKEDVALKHRLSRLLDVYEDFRSDLEERRKDEFEKRRKTAEKEFNNAVQKRKREVRERKAREAAEREAELQRQREEEERLEREAEQRAAEEEEKRQKVAEARAKREEERKYVAYFKYYLPSCRLTVLMFSQKTR